MPLSFREALAHYSEKLNGKRITVGSQEYKDVLKMANIQEPTLEPTIPEPEKQIVRYAAPGQSRQPLNATRKGRIFSKPISKSEWLKNETNRVQFNAIMNKIKT
jgi:hypothetical protein